MVFTEFLQSMNAIAGIVLILIGSSRLKRYLKGKAIP